MCKMCKMCKMRVNPIDVRAWTYRAGLLVDMSMPQHLFQIRAPFQVEMLKAQDLGMLDDMVGSRGVGASVRVCPNGEAPHRAEIAEEEEISGHECDSRDRFCRANFGI